MNPKLKFGEDKLAEVTVDVEFTEDKPRTVPYEDEFKGGQESLVFVIDCRVLSGPERGSMRSLFIPTDENHGLTRGIMNAAKPRNGRMKGMAVRIETKNYRNKRYKTLTRGYTVSEITPPDEVTP